MNGQEKITRKLEILKKCVDYLESWREVREIDLESNYELKSAIERNLQVAIDVVLDIGEIIISVNALKRPENYREVILILGEADILPREFAEEFAVSAGLRNILVHLYDEVKIQILCDILENKLENFSTFADYIVTYMQNKNT